MFEGFPLTLEPKSEAREGSIACDEAFSESEDPFAPSSERPDLVDFAILSLLDRSLLLPIPLKMLKHGNGKGSGFAV